ncbi:MAG: peptidyl-prolyl cis-trans isomerase SurA [Verrucomicrobiota bacterium]|jgi:peptidyl-prolyl cis-trans isomerase SurA
MTPDFEMKFLFHLFAVVLLGSWSVRAAEPDEMRVVSGIAAIANDALVTIREATVLATSSDPRLTRARESNPVQYERLFNRLILDATEHLVERQLILDDFKSSGLVFPESIIEDQIHDIIRERYGNRATLAKTLQADGMTIEGFRQQRREELILNEMEKRNVKQAIIISPAKIETYYQTNLAKYKLDDQVKLRGIVLKRGAISTADEIRQLAQEILTKIKGGADFAEMASIYNDPPRKDGGDWGWFETSKLSAGFVDVASGLTPGHISGVFSKSRDSENSYWIYFYDDAGKITRGRQYNIKDGKESFVEEKVFPGLASHDGLPALPQEFYLLKVDEKKIAHTRSINDLRDEIERDLIVQERARLRAKWVERLKAKSFVRRF